MGKQQRGGYLSGATKLLDEARESLESSDLDRVNLPLGKIKSCLQLLLNDFDGEVSRLSKEDPNHYLLLSGVLEDGRSFVKDAINAVDGLRSDDLTLEDLDLMEVHLKGIHNINQSFNCCEIPPRIRDVYTTGQ